MNQHKCRNLVMHHPSDVSSSGSSDITGQQKRHLEAWAFPQTNSELGVKQAIQAYACLADSYTDTFPDSLIGQDGYFGEHARDMLSAVSAWLTMGGKTRLDGGCVSRLIVQLAKASGVNPDEV